MYELTVKSHFDAAHALSDYPGECRQLHGHTWDVEVTVSGEDLNELGILYDFKDLKTDLGKVLGEYDHGYLNEVAPFDEISPTAENLARVIYERLAAVIGAKARAKIKVAEVSVWESPIAKIAYRP